MMKQLLLVCLLSFDLVQTQSNDRNQEHVNVNQECQNDSEWIDIAYQELVYEIGMNLAGQDLIIDVQSAKKAVLNLYEKIQGVEQIIDSFIFFDDELVELDLELLDDIIDYVLEDEEFAVQACLVWLQVYQKLFIEFQLLHGDDATVESWCEDMLYFDSLEEGQEPTNVNYLQLWQASIAVLEAQEILEDELSEA